MLIISYLKLIRRLFFRRISLIMFFLVCSYLKFIYNEYSTEPSDHFCVINIGSNNQCHCKPLIDKFILHYKPNASLGNKPDIARAEPTTERIRNLLEILRSKEDTYQSLLETFDVFNMLDPMQSLKPYTDESNIDEMKILYNRFITLMSNKKTIEVNPIFIDYLRKISSYLSDGFRNRRTNTFQVKCHRKPVFVLACDSGFFGGLQGAIRTLDVYWSDHQIIFYDLGITRKQEQLLRTKCKQCTIIKFPFSSIEKFAPHIRQLKNYGFKPFVVQDALRRYGSIIYGDSSARFNNNSFEPVLIDNYIRGFAARELPNHYLSCFTRSATFRWFNQSHTHFDNVYMAEANFLAVTDTFLTRLIMKAWLICALESDCLIVDKSPTICSRQSAGVHRYDQSVMVIILTYFFFQGNQSSWSNISVYDPAPYDMFTSIRINLGDIKRGLSEINYLSEKQID